MSDIAATHESRRELTFQVPLAEIYRFNEPEKAKELGQAFETGRQRPAAMAPAKRFIISTIGIFCLMIGLTGLFGRNPNIFSFLWIVLGAAIIWVFLVKPEMDRKKAGTISDTKKDPEVTLVVNPGRIIMRSPHNETALEWTEFVEYKKTKKGIRLSFVDGTNIWLPENAFYDKDEMKELLQLLQKKVSSSKSQVSGEEPLP
ncbi:MAG: hypothetical protein A4E60_00738 [Syntrophorhabdus sp. PtaB.Bin047]|jgi:hypothetical protein|nr:MAG: hypothetical protein A4E60_00738 [Syntrophorhabdus sp. PtaB.Bin047]